MSWAAFKKGFRDLRDPPYLRNMTPEQRQKRRRDAERHVSDYWLFLKAIEPKPPPTRKSKTEPK